MTFGDLLSDTYDRLRYPASPASAIVTRIKRLMNEAHREILTTPGLSRLREDLLVLSTAAVRFGFPSSVGRIRQITDREQQVVLEDISVADLRARNPGRDQTGRPERYAVIGVQPVALQPPAATELFVTSTSASDTQTCHVEGIRSNGTTVVLSATLTGVTPKSMGVTETAIVEVTKWYVATAAVGTLTLENGLGADLGQIGIGRTSTRHLTVEWDPIPDTTVTLYADVTRHLTDLVNTADEPQLPEDFHPLLGLRTRMKAYEGIDDDRGVRLEAEWQRGVMALRSYVLHGPSTVLSLRSARDTHSSLGPMYPAGS